MNASDQSYVVPKLDSGTVIDHLDAVAEQPDHGVMPRDLLGLQDDVAARIATDHHGRRVGQQHGAGVSVGQQDVQPKLAAGIGPRLVHLASSSTGGDSGFGAEPSAAPSTIGSAAKSPENAS